MAKKATAQTEVCLPMQRSLRESLAHPSCIGSGPPVVTRQHTGSVCWIHDWLDGTVLKQGCWNATVKTG